MTEWIERFYVQTARSNLFTLMFKFAGKQQNISWKYKINLSAKTVMRWSKINTIFTTVPGITVARNSLIFLVWKGYICLPTPRFEIPRFPFPREEKHIFYDFIRNEVCYRIFLRELIYVAMTKDDISLTLDKNEHVWRLKKRIL